MMIRFTTVISTFSSPVNCKLLRDIEGVYFEHIGINNNITDYLCDI